MKRIWNIVVDKISLLTTEHQPAVPKAWLWFSILKFFTPSKINKKTKQKLDNIIEKLWQKEIIKISKIDEIIERFEKMDKRP